MELFNTTGFEVDDKVFVIIDDKKYTGIVLKTDSDRNRIKVDYTAKSKEHRVDWFHKSFWKKYNS
jgi:hypothetical protein